MRIDVVGSCPRNTTENVPADNAPKVPAFATGEIEIKVPAVNLKKKFQEISF